MSRLTKAPALPERAETGPLQFGDDWPGVFIRGDNALAYAMALKAALAGDNSAITLSVLEGLRKQLMSCDVRNLEDDLEQK